MELKKRFWSKVDKSGDCWLWTGALVGDGYGIIWHNGRNKLAHRASYELHHGEIEDGLVVMHTCDNPKCVNPDHLVKGTQKDNIADRDRKGRGSFGGAKGEKSGSAKLTNEVVKEIRSMYKSTDISKRGLARQFGVTHPTIIKVLDRTHWSHV